MSPEAGILLLDEIAPRLRSAIPRCVNAVGAEDAEELIQDGIAIAAKMLHNAEVAQKKVTPGNIAYYTLQHLRSGRRSVGNSCADVLAAGTQINNNSSVLSTEDEVGYDPELDEPIHLGELLGSTADDPSQEAARNLDWDEFLSTHDYRYGVVSGGIAAGQIRGEIAKQLGVCASQVTRLTGLLADDVVAFMGEDLLLDAVRAPAWRANLRVKSEQAACRADRRRG